MIYNLTLQESVIDRAEFDDYIKLSKLYSAIKADYDEDLYSLDNLSEYKRSLAILSLKLEATRLKSLSLQKENEWCSPWFVTKLKMDTCGVLFNINFTDKLLQNMQESLDTIAPELKALHARLIEIKKELKSLLRRNSPHAFSLLEVHTLQDELREIDSAKWDGKYMNKDKVVLCGQARVTDLIETCYDDVHELLSAKDVVAGDNPLRNVYEKLIALRAQLESHQLTYRWTLNSSCLVEIQRSLGEIDNLRTDGKFLDAQGRIPEGQAVLHFLLHKCYRLVRKLVTVMEPVSEELMNHYNQLITLRKCLLELKRWDIQLSERELLPYTMKLSAIEKEQVDGSFVGSDGQVLEGSELLSGLIQECHAQLEHLQ